MPKRFLPPLVTRLADEAVDRVVRALDDRIQELASVRVSQGRLMEAIELADATETQVNHGLGRPAKWIVCRLLDPSTSGRIEEITGGRLTRNNSLTLKASGWGATITVDLWVF